MPVKPIGGTSASGTLVSSLSPSYSPTAGNTVVLFVAASASISSVQDSKGNAATAGPQVSVAGITSGYQSFYFANSASGVTGYTIAFSGSSSASTVLEEYAGNTSGVNAGLAGNSVSWNIVRDGVFWERSNG